MTDTTPQSPVRLAVTSSAIFLAAFGLAMTFAPQETAAAVGMPASPVIGQLLGAAVLGFAVMNWTARGSTLGGIYGRAVVAGNQMHFTVGGLALLNHMLSRGGPPALWVLSVIYVLGAALFLNLMFRGGPRG